MMCLLRIISISYLDLCPGEVKVFDQSIQNLSKCPPQSQDVSMLNMDRVHPGSNTLLSSTMICIGSPFGDLALRPKVKGTGII
jgi:hypothetical protein